MLVDKNKIIQGDSAQFNLVLRTHFLEANDNPDVRLKPKEKNQLADGLYRLLQSDARWTSDNTEVLIESLEKASGLTMNPIERAEFKFNVLALTEFDSVSELDCPLNHLLAQCRHHLLINSLVEKQFLLSGHPLKKLLDFMHDNLLGFDSKFGKVLLPLYDFVTGMVREVQKTPWNDNLGYQKLIKEAEEKINTLTERFFMIADRMMATETGHIKAQQANQTINHFLVSLLQGKKLPSDVSQVLLNQLYDELKILLVTEGAKSERWLRFSKMVKTLVMLYQPGCPIDNKTQNLWQNLPDQLEAMIKEMDINSPHLEKWLDTIRFDYFHLAQGQALTSLMDVELPLELSKQSNQLVEADAADIQSAQSYSEGQWFLLRDAQGLQRVYVTYKLAEFNQYLFINILGQKVAGLDAKQFSDYVGTGALSPLVKNGVCIQLYAKAVDQLLQDFYERYERFMQSKKQQAELALKEKAESDQRVALELKAEQQRLDQERKEQEKVAQAQREEEKRLLREKAKLEREKEKAKQEAELEKQKLEVLAKSKALEEEKRSEATKKKRLLEEKRTELISKQIRIALDTLSLGARIDYQSNADSAVVRAKLAVKFNATKRYVFIDHDGFTIIDATRNEIVDMILAGSVVLVDIDGRLSQDITSLVERSKNEAVLAPA